MSLKQFKRVLIGPPPSALPMSFLRSLTRAVQLAPLSSLVGTSWCDLISVKSFSKPDELWESCACFAALLLGSTALTFGQAANPTKEYVYLGSKLVAIDTTGSGSSSPGAELYSPQVGEATGGSKRRFLWSSGGQNAQEYSLQVGTAVGGTQYYNGVEPQGTAEREVTGLPCSGAIYVRLRTKYAGQWATAKDYQFPAACPADPRAVLESPVVGTQLASTTPTFTWTSGTGAQDYWLDIGTAFAQGNLWAGVVPTTSKQSVALPCAAVNSTNPATIYIRLYTRIGGAWQTPNDYTYKQPPSQACSADPRASLTTPTPGSALPYSTMTFTWAAGPQGADYWLDVGNTGVGQGTTFGGLVSTTSKQVTGIPCTGTIHVRLYTRISGTWQAPIDYTFGPPPAVECNPANSQARLQSPTPGSVLKSHTVNFSWSPGNGAQSYWLDVGTAQGQGTITAGELTAMSKEVAGIPCSAPTIHSRLWTKKAGAWLPPLDYTFGPPPPQFCPDPTTTSVSPSSVYLGLGQPTAFTALIADRPATQTHAVTWTLKYKDAQGNYQLATPKSVYGELLPNGEYTAPTAVAPQWPSGTLIVYAEASFTPTLAVARAEIQVRYYPVDCTYRYQPSNINGVGQDLNLLMWQQDGTCQVEQFRPAVQLLISNGGPVNPSIANQCYIVYYPGSGQILQLWDDAGINPSRSSSSWFPQKANINNTNYIVREGGGMTTNSQCHVDYSFAWERFGGTPKFMEWNTPIYFHQTFAGPKTMKLREATTASAWIELGPWTVPDKPSLPPIGDVTSPAENSSFATNVNITFQGWALDNASKSETHISKVKVYANGHYLGTANLGLSNSAACAPYGGLRPGCPNVGWDFTVNSGVLGAGTQLMEFVVYDGDTPSPQIRILRRTITVTP